MDVSVEYLVRLAQTLDESGEHEAADVVDSTITPNQDVAAVFEQFKSALGALDQKLTDRNTAGKDNDILGFLYEHREYYLSDGGYSRVVMREAPPDYTSLHMFPTSNSLQSVFDRWESAQGERDAVLRLAQQLFNDEAYAALSK